MHSLPLFANIAGQPILLIGTGEAANAKRRLIERAGGQVVGESDTQSAKARIAFIALDDPEGTAMRLKAKGLLVNVVDRPDLCDFTTPAIVDRAPVLIAVSTGGASSGLAAALRQRLEAMLPTRLGALADALKAARQAMRARWPEAGERRRALAQALAPGGLLDPFDRPDVDHWLAEPGDLAASSILTVHLRSDNPDDLTLGEARALGQADRIIYSPDSPPAILARARADALRFVLNADEMAPDAPGLTVRIIAVPT